MLGAVNKRQTENISNPASQMTVVLRRDQATNFNGGARTPIEEVAVVVRRSFDATPIRKLFHDKFTANGGDGVVTTTIQINNNDEENPLRVRRRSIEGRQSARGHLNQLFNRGSFQHEMEMDINLIEDRTPYDSVESEIGITTNRGYQDDYYPSNITAAAYDSPIDFVSDEKTPPTPSTMQASTTGATIDMPIMSTSPSDEFMYALEHVL